MQLIENTQDLKELTKRLSQEKFVCIDSEFLREHTYFAKLCLIQIASEKEAAIIDPLANDIDLTPFFDLMQNQNIVKVFHSGRQDIEIIYNLSGRIPTPLYDTQIAAQAAGFGEYPSYENVVSHILHIELDKSSRLSDWAHRPLDTKQLNYALSDVTHLVNIYLHLTAWLEKHGRTHWIDEEINALSNESLFKIDPNEAWLKIRHRSHSSLFLTTLRELAAWREMRAINKDVPRHSFIKDDLLLNICAAQPNNKQELAVIRGMRTDLASGKIGDEILEVLQKVKSLPKEDYATPCYPPEISGADSSLMELLKLLLKVKAQEEKIVARMIASEDDLKLFCIREDDKVPFMHDWRYAIFGQYAEMLRDGKTAIAYNAEYHSLKFIAISEQN